MFGRRATSRPGVERNELVNLENYRVYSLLGFDSLTRIRTPYRVVSALTNLPEKWRTEIRLKLAASFESSLSINKPYIREIDKRGVKKITEQITRKN